MLQLGSRGRLGGDGASQVEKPGGGFFLVGCMGEERERSWMRGGIMVSVRFEDGLDSPGGRERREKNLVFFFFF